MINTSELFTSQDLCYDSDLDRCNFNAFSFDAETEENPLSHDWMQRIVDEIKIKKPKFLLEKIEHVLFVKNGGSDRFEVNRCPYIFLNIGEKRKLCITIIPSDETIQRIIKEQFCNDKEAFINEYYTSAVLMHQLMPNHVLPHYLIDDFYSYALVISEGIGDIFIPYEIRNTDRVPDYLETKEQIKKNFIDPLLGLIDALHCSGYCHGDLTAGNILLSRATKKMIFSDFKFILKKRDLKLRQLIDLIDASNSIIIYMRNFNYQNHWVLFYLKKLVDALDVFYEYEDNDEVEILFIDFTIDDLKKQINFFWNLPDITIEQVLLSDLANYNQKEISYLYYKDERFFLKHYPEDQLLSTAIMKSIKTKINYSNQEQLFNISEKRNIKVLTRKLDNTVPFIKHYTSSEFLIYISECNQHNEIQLYPSRKKLKTNNACNSIIENMKHCKNMKDLLLEVEQSDKNPILNETELNDYSEFINNNIDSYLLGLIKKMRLKFFSSDFLDKLRSDFDVNDETLNQVSLYDEIHDDNANFPNNAAIIYLKVISHWFASKSHLAYCLTFAKIKENVLIFWNIPAECVVSVSYEEVTEEKWMEIDLAYQNALQENKVFLMQFYEECYPGRLSIENVQYSFT